MLRAFRRLMRTLQVWWRGAEPPARPHDPYARTPEPLRPRPKNLSGAVAVAEPDE